jgi:hypothetical protein
MDDDSEREARIERAARSRAEAEATLERLADLDHHVRESRVDEQRGHHDPVRRNPDWRSPPEPSAPTERRLSDTEWGRALKGEILAALEERLLIERERTSAILAEVIAGESGEAPAGLAKDLAELLSAISEVSRSLATSAEADRRAREAIDLPNPLPRRAMN